MKKKNPRKPILIYINGEVASKVLQFSRILGLSRSIIIENLLTQRLKDSLPKVEKELLLLTQHNDDLNSSDKGLRQDLDSRWLKSSWLRGEDLQWWSWESSEMREREDSVSDVTLMTEDTDGHADVWHSASKWSEPEGTKKIPQGIPRIG